ncbi:hypothetical protein DH2020_030221 [Rehmannia glutinosa]|uniref:Mvd1 C-terminal domain-containing protein n=1 Tax=Rehmannia glutinosa TaxID=99300 RepID=A0ABR0VLE9_REHGL
MAAESGKKWVLDGDGADADEHSGDKVLGKRDEDLPSFRSTTALALLFDPDHLCTTTSVAVSPAFTQDRMWLNGKMISVVRLSLSVHMSVECTLSGGRYQNCLRELRSRTSDVEDEEKGIKITKRTEKLHVHVVSYNNFLLLLGWRHQLLANCWSHMTVTSRNFITLLCYCFFPLAANECERRSQQNCLLLQGKVREVLVAVCMVDLSSGSWEKRKMVATASLFNLQMRSTWDDLVIIIAVVSSRQNETSSTLACVILLKPDVISCVEKWNRHEETPQNKHGGLYLDAGPNAVLISHNRKAAALLLQRLLFYFPLNAGIHEMKDIEALAPPPEIMDTNLTQRHKGDVSYFICTRPGRGPVVLTDESRFSY